MGTSEFEALNRQLVEHNDESENGTLRREMGVKRLKNGFNCTTRLGEACAPDDDENGR